jgi:hypothetical protein
MSFIPKPNDSDFELPPAGTHLALCYRVIDLGTQKTTYLGQAKEQHKVMLSWELPEEKMKDGRPFTISQRYTWSMSEKATLRKHLESWRGLAFTDNDFGPGGFNVKNVLTKACTLAVSHTEKNGKQYANVTSVSKPMKGLTIPPLVNEAIYLWLTPDLFEDTVFQKLSQGLQGAIMQSPEYGYVTGRPNDEPPPADANDFHSDDIPF